LPTDRRKGALHRRRLGRVLAVALLSLPTTARADDVVAVYTAYWAGLPAAEIRLRLHDGAAAYHDEIEIRTIGLPALLSKFRGTALAEGSLTADQPAEPSHYDAIYDLRKRRNSHISMRFVPRAGAVIAERGPDDTSRKPPLAEKFRSNAVDPMTALERLRGVLRARARSADRSFAIPVYDGARRFGIEGFMLLAGRVVSAADAGHKAAGLRHTQSGPLQHRFVKSDQQGADRAEMIFDHGVGGKRRGNRNQADIKARIRRSQLP